MEYLFLIVGGLIVIIANAFVVNRIHINNILKKRIILIDKVIEHGYLSDLLALQEQQIVLADDQKLTILLKAYSTHNNSVIDYLKELGYKLSLRKIKDLFLVSKDPEQIKFFLHDFLDKKVVDGAVPALQHIIKVLCAKDNLDIISLLLKLYPIDTCKCVFTLAKQEKKNELFFQFVNNNIKFLQDNNYLFNSLEFGANIELINFLLKKFPNGQLQANILTRIIKDLLRSKIDNLELYTELCCQIKHRCTNNLQGYILNLKEIMDYSTFADRLDIFELIIKSNLDFLSKNTKEADSLIAAYVCRNLVIAEIFFRNGISVNRNIFDKLSIVERSIIDNAKTEQDNQAILNMLLRYNLDLHTKIIKNKPDNIEEISLLSYLVFTSLVVSNNSDFYALRLQKFMAMFFDIPGVSYSNGSLCAHEYMRDSHAHWNYILDLYFQEFESNLLIQDLVDDRKSLFNSCLKGLYSTDGTYANQLIYDNYINALPIVLPVNLRGFCGESHIATVGFIKINESYHLRVEADSGLGRRDFSIFIEPTFGYQDLLRYTRSAVSPISLADWHKEANYSKKNHLTIFIEAQKSNSCPSMSVKYAFFIAYFLCQISNAPSFLEENAQQQKRFFAEIYKISNAWFKNFLALTQRSLLQHYQELDPKYIDSAFLAKARELAGEANFAVSSPSALLCEEDKLETISNANLVF